MIEKVIFFVLTFVLSIIYIWKLIRRFDKLYIGILVLQFFGLCIRVADLKNSGELSSWAIFSYFLCIIIPVGILFLEKKMVFLSESVSIYLAKLYIKKGNNELAKKKLLKIIAKYPNSYFAHKMLAEIYEKEGKVESAIDEYVRAVEINSKDFDSYFQIAYLLNQVNRSSESEKMLKNILRKKPEFYKASELLGTIYYDAEKFEEAVSVYQNALEYNPTRYELYYGIAMAYTRLNDFQIAKEYYEKAAQLNSMLFHAKLNIAQIALIMGDLDEAEEEFLECLQDVDSEGYAYYYLAVIALYRGDKERAKSYLKTAVELDKSIYDLLFRHDVFAELRKEINVKETKVRKYSYTKQEARTKRYLDETLILINKMKKNNAKAGGAGEKKIEIEEKQIDEH